MRLIGLTAKMPRIISNYLQLNYGFLVYDISELGTYKVAKLLEEAPDRDTVVKGIATSFDRTFVKNRGGFILPPPPTNLDSHELKVLVDDLMLYWRNRSDLASST